MGIRRFITTFMFTLPAIILAAAHGDNPQVPSDTVTLAIAYVESSAPVDLQNKNSSLTIPTDTSEPEDALQTIAVHVPLGRAFKVLYTVGGEKRRCSVKLKCGTTESLPISANATIQNAVTTVPSPKLPDPRNYGYLLFKGQVLITLGPTNRIAEAEFLPVHLGSATVVIQPAESIYPPLNLAVTVDKPPFLGAKAYYPRDTAQLNSYLVEVANLTGMPPQLLKGWVQQETFAIGDEFNVETYRYEPNYQRLYINNPTPDLVSSLANFALQDPAEKWATNGADLTQPTSNPVLNFRNRYKICTANCTNPSPTQQQRFIQQSDLSNRTISSFDIINANRYYNYLGKYFNWSNEASVQMQKERYKSTAQTAIAASYGLVNMMLPTFRDLLSRKLRLLNIDSPMFSPSYLIDSAENLATKDIYGVPGGSLFLSVINVYYGFGATGRAWQPVTDNDFAVYLESFRSLLDIHNPYQIDPVTKQKEYGRDVLACSKNYLPQPAGCTIISGESC